MAPAVDTVTAALLVLAQMLPLATGSHTTIISVGMKAGDTCAIVTDLTGHGNGGFLDFLCDFA